MNTLARRAATFANKMVSSEVFEALYPLLFQRDRLVLEWPDFTLKKPSEDENPDNYAEMLVK